LAVTRYWVGCSGWGYDDWVGPFYPPGTPPGGFLERYARVFPLVEVDSSFYRPPSMFLVRRWISVTPDGFRFTLKVPRDFTHEAAGPKATEALRLFLEGVRQFHAAKKLGAVVLQFPASFRRDRTPDRLAEILQQIPAEYPVAVELRHASWWTEPTRHELEERSAALVWSVIPHTEPPAWVTGEFLYARFVGDRALTKFDHIQRDKRAEMETLRDRFENEGRSALTVYTLVNNHYMGFGPGSAQILQEVLGLPPSDLANAARETGQQSLDHPR
jgi:uncharacterized protein YecE (DUF72 family)